MHSSVTVVGPVGAAHAQLCHTPAMQLRVPVTGPVLPVVRQVQPSLWPVVQVAPALPPSTLPVLAPGAWASTARFSSPQALTAAPAETQMKSRFEERRIS